MKRIENKAYAILSKLNIKDAGDIDVIQIARHFGISVQNAQFDDDISGLFVEKNGKYYITYNKKHVKERKRFTIAHELGHFTLHRASASLFIDKAFYRNSDSSTGEYRKEREANAFAAALLMPSAFVAAEWEKNKGIKDNSVFMKELATTFRVSEIAMTYRLSNLGYDLAM